MQFESRSNPTFCRPDFSPNCLQSESVTTCGDRVKTIKFDPLLLLELPLQTTYSCGLSNNRALITCLTRSGGSRKLFTSLNLILYYF